MIKWGFPITILNLLLAASLLLDAQTFTTLHNFTNTDGQFPIAGLVLSSNVLYGTTSQGGSQSNGTVFAVNIDGSHFKVLHNFTATDPFTGTNWDGAFPNSGLVLSGSTLFGTTSEGGTNTEGSFGYGTIFSVNTDGSDFTVLHQFNGGSDGYSAHARLLFSNGILYGTTYLGGIGEGSVGTMFSVNTNGTSFNVMHAFNGEPDGAHPEGDLILVSNVFYGTTEDGGAPGASGIAFSFNTNDAFPDGLHDFKGTVNGVATGTFPHSGLLYSSNKLFGTTLAGGSQGNGIIFSMNTDGNNYVALHNFTTTDGAWPDADLISCGNTFYGTTYLGGSQSNGVVFAMNTDGSSYTVLHNFTKTNPETLTNDDGANSESSLVMLNNTLYGTATFGGSQGNGTIFSLQLPSIASIACNQDGSVTINFGGGANTNLVQAAVDLVPPIAWQTISTNKAEASGLWQFTDTNTSSCPFRFYRSSTL